MTMSKPRNVVTLHEPISTTLHRLADDIEAGKFGSLPLLAVVMQSADGAIEVVGAGPGAVGATVAVMLYGGFVKAAGISFGEIMA